MAGLTFYPSLLAPRTPPLLAPEQDPADGLLSAGAPPPQGGSFYTAVAPLQGLPHARHGFTPQAAWAASTAGAAKLEASLDGETEAPAPHKHKSSWHAALNKRIIALPSAEDGALFLFGVWRWGGMRGDGCT
ncbi:unnamed protein product [Prorocentrum cordatum]|uniref:Uncharacterized protein n=1 Tax=Prorocentrum cordatum TaxID=2364126 RepID=A0ABN9SXD3_9DINO|nr:unnamed protein product [Polarella glacialis]